MRKIGRTISELIAWLLVVLAVASCSTPEKLIDKAVKKDPTILTQYADTVTLTRVEVDSIEVQIGDTVIWEKIVTEHKYDTVFYHDKIYIERKKSRQEIRKEFKLDKLKARLEAKYQKREQKLQARIDKLTERLKSKETRQEKRLDSKEKRSNRFWLGFFLGVLAVVLITLGLRLLIRKQITLY